MHAIHALADGTLMPALGLGTWKSSPGVVEDAVRAALRAGYRHLDCAAVYGNEREVGRALAGAFAAGEVRREELWVTSKLWNDRHHPDDVGPALERTLSDLGLERLDLYLVHWPVAHARGTVMPRGPEGLVPLDVLPLERTWEAMLAQKARGLTRQVGVSNFSLPKIRRLRDVGEGPAANQVELHPYLAQEALVRGCQEMKVAVTAYSPLGSPDSAAFFNRKDEQPLLSNPVVVELARSKGATPGQILIAWALHRGTSVIPKSTNEARIRENLGALEIGLGADDMRALAGLDRHQRLVDATAFCLGQGYTAASIWDE